MKIFELHFNPKPKSKTSDLFFDSFCYEPKNIYEKKLGNLYMIGELKNLLPINIQLLDRLSKVIKENFYSSRNKTAEKNFELSLKKANEFLAEELSRENVSWLGNLNFSSLSLTPNRAKNPLKKWWKINLTKTGNIRILLFRDHKITNIDKDIDLEEIEPYPLKVFVKTITGKIFFGDKIIIVTQDIFNFLNEKKIINDFARINLFTEQKIREVLKKENKEISTISGALLLIDTKQETIENSNLVTFKKEFEKFNIKEVFSPVTNYLSSLTSKVYPKKKSSNTKSKTKNEKKQKLNFSFPSFKFPIIDRFNFNNYKGVFLKIFKDNLKLIVIFLCILLIGSFIFRDQEKRELEIEKVILQEIQEKILKAENLLIQGNNNEADLLLQEVLEKIIPLTEHKRIEEEAVALKESIESNLRKIHNIEIFSKENIIFEFNPREFTPQKLTFIDQELYVFNSNTKEVYKINPETKEKVIYPVSDKFNLTIKYIDSILLFSNPNKIITLIKNNDLFEEFSLKPPYSEFNFIDIAFYQENLYLLEKESNNIIKYASPLILKKDNPQIWLDPQTKKPNNPISMSIDGSIWVLEEDNNISRYYIGQHQEDLKIIIYPSPEKFTKVIAITNVPYLYILEPIQKRIIVLEKNGKVVKQFQMPDFEDIKDFTISSDGRKIYLLDHQTIYQVNL